MENSTIKIDFQKKEFSQNGVDEVKFLISANEGEPLKSLSKVASGGELSRIMLGLKIIYTNKNSSLLTIFDEIDTGVSGRVAQRMAEKIYQLSISSQVFAITHLPQMVAIADNNLLIKKKEINGRTISDVYELDDNKKVIEIAKMISTSSITEITKKHSLEMINNAKKIMTDIEDFKVYEPVILTSAFGMEAPRGLGIEEIILPSKLFLKSSQYKRLVILGGGSKERFLLPLDDFSGIFDYKFFIIKAAKDFSQENNLKKGMENKISDQSDLTLCSLEEKEVLEFIKEKKDMNLFFKDSVGRKVLLIDGDKKENIIKDLEKYDFETAFYKFQ